MSLDTRSRSPHSHALAPTLGGRGRIRELSCRGKAGIALKVDLDPSPRDTASVVMSLDYTRSTAVLRDSLRLLAPGSCTWNSHGWDGYPAEPGRVLFDVRRQAQRWADTPTRMMDSLRALRASSPIQSRCRATCTMQLEFEIKGYWEVPRQ